jgi:hypothetical protein
MGMKRKPSSDNRQSAAPSKTRYTQAEPVFIRDKTFLLRIPAELHSLATEAASDTHLSLHEFILRSIVNRVRQHQQLLISLEEDIPQSPTDDEIMTDLRALLEKVGIDGVLEGLAGHCDEATKVLGGKNGKSPTGPALKRCAGKIREILQEG